MFVQKLRGRKVEKMGDINKFYKNTENAPPHKTVKKFIEMKIEPTNAIDIGCGAGRDTIYLIKNGWNVLAIDREDTKKMIVNKLNDEEIKRFKFSCQNFENIQLEKTNLVVANFSIPFCDKKYFTEFWKRITECILKNRILCWQFFWD